VGINFKQTIEEIKNQTDILAVISGYVQLKKRGKNHIGLCPFHSEKTASFTVSPEKNIFHCFGCSEGGNAIDFIMKIEGLEFIEALKLLGDKVGIPVETKAVDPKTKSERLRFYSINEEACKFFESHLDTSVVSYFEQRGVKKEQLKIFRIGFSKEGWDNLTKHLIGRGFNPADIERTGLIIKKENQNEYFDRFRNRIIFPIIDMRGKILGFSGRAFGNFEPKYLNSPDSPIFHKGETLFGLNLAHDAIKKKRFAILVEGNVDLMMCHQHNLQNTVAPLGTAFSQAQAKLIKRFADTVAIAFDADPAGLIAAERAEAQLRETDIEVRIVDLKDKKDPADFLAEKGEEAFLKLLKESQAALEFKIKRKIQKYDLKRIESKAKATAEVVEILSKEKNPVIVNEYIKLSAKLLGLEDNILVSEIKRKSFYKKKRGFDKSRYIINKPATKRIEAEKSLIRFAFENKSAREIISKEIVIKDFSNPQYADIMERLLKLSSPEIDDLNSEAEKVIVRGILLHGDPVENLEQSIKDCILTIKKEELQTQSNLIRTEIKKEEALGNFERVKGLQEEFTKLGEIFRSLSR